MLAYYNGNIVGAALGSANGVITIDNGTLNTSATRPKAFIATSANNEVGSLTSSSGGYPMFNASGVPQVQTFEPNKLVMTGSNGLLGTGTLPNDGFLYNNNGDIAARVFGTTAGTVAEGNHTHSNYATTGALAAVDTKATQANTAATQAKSRADEAYQFATDNFTYITQV